MKAHFSRSSRALGLLLAVVALLAAACGSEDTQIEAAAPAASVSDEAVAESADMDGQDAMDADGAMGGDMDMSEHAHGDSVEVADGIPTPSIELEAFVDPKGGWTLHAKPSNHRIAPENASTAAIDGEGHMHLYIDGERIGRIYNEWVAIPALGEGSHELRVELSANNHAALAIDGDIVDATVTVNEVPSDSTHHHGADTYEVADGLPEPSVTIEVFEDPKSGWNVRAVPTNHELNALAVSTEAVDGEGHMHLYVDDERVTRLYGEWYHLGDQTDGDHTIRVELSANNHAALSIDGVIVDASTTITQVDGVDMVMGGIDGSDSHGEGHDDGDSHDDGHGDGDSEMADMTDMAEMPEADSIISLAINDGEVSGDTGRVDIELGSTVAIMVDGDADEEIHVHGYDIHGDITADQDGLVVFVADIPGIFEVELEAAGTLLVELKVS